MSERTHNQSSLTEQDDDYNEPSSPIVVDHDDTLPLYNTEKMANNVLEQFFDEIKTHDDGTKSAKCLLCRTVVKQSTTSTYNYGRHVHRKHTKEMDKWNLPSFKRKRLFSGYEGQKTPMNKKRSYVSESIESEISMFEKEIRDDTNLVFLKKDSYPCLHRLATRVHCVPATSAPVERVFSSSGILMRPHRSRLSKNMLSMLTLLKCNRQLL